jgi:putative cell wall-binding protein
MPISIRRIGLATAATSLALGACIATAGTANADASFDFTRIEGDNRYLTSVKAAKEFGTAETVIIASGETGRYADALTANYLAGVKGAPVLLTRQNETPEEVKQALKDLGAKTVYIVGGADVVSQSQQDSLDDAYTVRRLAGDNRYETAAAVIGEGDKASTDTALLATGVKFPDALGAGPVSFAEKMPLAITRQDDAPDEVVKALDIAGIKKVLVLGGEDVVGKAVVAELEAKGITVVKRFAGKDRAETSAMLAEYALTTFGFSATAVNVASGYNKGGGVDALSGAPLTGKQERALLITRSETTPGDGVLAFLDNHAATLTQGIIFGGEAALTKSAEFAMEKAALDSGAQNVGTGEFYDTVQAAIDEAKAGDTITVFGAQNAGFTVNKSDLTIKGEDGAKLTSAVVIRAVDGVNVSGFAVTPSDVGQQVAGFYLDNAEGVVITGNSVLGDGSDTGAGVINASGGEKEAATIAGNTFRDLRQGVYANPSADFKIDSNVFRGNLAGSANDVASVITNNEFINNGEGIGLGGAGSTITGNEFINNAPHVADWTADKSYDLPKIIQDNTFDEPVKVNDTDTAIVDQS